MGIRSTTEFKVPGENETITAKCPSQMRVRALKAQATVEKRLPGEEKDEAIGWALMRLILHDSIVGWTYCDEAGEAIPVTDETIDELDNGTAKWLFDAVMGNERAEGKESG